MILSIMMTTTETTKETPSKDTRVTLINPENIVIRRAFTSFTESENDKIADVVEKAYRAGGHINEKNADYLVRLRGTEHRAEYCKIFVAVLQNDNKIQNDTILGTLSVVEGIAKEFLGGEHPYIDLADSDEAELRMLAVDPDYQGYGIGSMLIDRAFESVRESNEKMKSSNPSYVMKSIVCYSSRHMTSAHALYEKHGFERKPEYDTTYEDGETYWALKAALKN